jgi:hypothetical protein
MEVTGYIFRGVVGVIDATGIYLEFPVIPVGLQCRSEAALAPLFGALGKTINFECHSFFFSQESFRWTTDFCHVIFVGIAPAPVVVVIPAAVTAVVVVVIIIAAGAAADVATIVVVADVAAMAAERFPVGAIVIIIDINVKGSILSTEVLFSFSPLESRPPFVILFRRQDYVSGCTSSIFKNRCTALGIATTSKSLENVKVHRVRVCVCVCVWEENQMKRDRERELSRCRISSFRRR